MSFPATPLANSLPGPDQRLVTPPVTKSYDTPMPNKRRAVQVQGGQAAQIVMQLLDNTGVPSDLVTYGVSTPGTPLAGARMRIRETVGIGTAPVYDLGAGTVLNAALGSVQFVVPDAVVQNPGVYDAECAVFDSAGALAFTNRLYVWVERGLYNSGNTPTAGPPTLDDIRLHLRDSDPAGNLLIDDFEWDLADVCTAVAQAVRYWNEAQPPINQCYNTTTYPFQHYWMDGVAGYLYQMAAAHYRRNRLQYQAGGVAVDDLNREKEYMAAGQAKQAEYREWVKQKKVQLNCEAAFTTFGSGYGTMW